MEECKRPLLRQNYERAKTKSEKCSIFRVQRGKEIRGGGMVDNTV